MNWWNWWKRVGRRSVCSLLLRSIHPSIIHFIHNWLLDCRSRKKKQTTLTNSFHSLSLTRQGNSISLLASERRPQRKDCFSWLREKSELVLAARLLCGLVALGSAQPITPKENKQLASSLSLRKNSSSILRWTVLLGPQGKEKII